MAIIPWEPLKDLEKFFEEDWDFMPVIPVKGANIPPMDISEDKDNVYVEVPLVGVKPEDVEVIVEDNVLTVRGKSEEEKEEKKKNYYRKEIKKGSFERSVTLPTEVKADKAGAEAKNGILKITLPKLEKKKAKTVKVKVKK
jgi:HSP20 family protein